jgi:hypothetical protein
MHQNVSNRNKPKHRNAPTRKKLDFVPGRGVLVPRFVSGRHHLVLTFVPGRHYLVLTFVLCRGLSQVDTLLTEIFIFLGSPNIPLSYTKSFPEVIGRACKRQVPGI